MYVYTKFNIYAVNAQNVLLVLFVCVYQCFVYFGSDMFYLLCVNVSFDTRFHS